MAHDIEYFTRDQVIAQLSGEGFKHIEIKTLDQQIKYEEFVDELYPYYNEQQQFLL